MDTYKTVVSKRDTRSFLEKPIAEEERRRILQAGRMAGSSKNAQPCRFIVIDDQSAATPRRIADAARSGHIDGLLTMNATTGLEAVTAGRILGHPPGLTIGTFDLGPDVLRAVKAGQLAFAVDQQAYLQGYLPVVMLAERARYGLFPAQGDVVATGPNFVTRATAGKAIELSKRSIR